MSGAEETAILLVACAVCLAIGASTAPRLGADAVGERIARPTHRSGAVALVALAGIVLVVGCVG